MTKPKILMFATGGSIFSSATRDTDMLTYSTEGLQVEEVLREAPSINQIADIETTTFCNLPSSSMTSEIWISLAKTIEEAARRHDVAGIVITHGTDTMEETAFFLNMVLKTSKPVVLTGAMRPATALSSDGPINLYNAVKVAGTPEARSRGVLVVMNGVIIGARDVTMSHTTSLDTFKAREFGMLGMILGDQLEFFAQTTRPHTICSQFSLRDFEKSAKLPRVEIIIGHADDDGFLIQTCVNRGVSGIVYAGCGHGSISPKVEEVLSQAAANGCIVVRASRTGAGCVFNGRPRWQDEGFIPAGSLSPQKARILLQLALNRLGNDETAIRSIFRVY